MQFTSTLAVLALAITSVIASPTPNQTPAQQAESKCSNNQKLMCCNSINQQFLSFIPINLGLGCTVVDVLSIVPLAQQCSGGKVACCDQNNQQDGFINVGNICAQPLVL